MVVEWVMVLFIEMGDVERGWFYISGFEWRWYSRRYLFGRRFRLGSLFRELVREGWVGEGCLVWY